jgi:exopolyphosphatase/guanosine-5'-triphosphate,3'-diphosphate pyrophosphatase
MSVAVIDCGTNSTRLLVVDDNGVTLAREMTITRLGQEVAATGRLHPDALVRVYNCLKRYREIMDSFGVTSGTLVATSAARDASNGAEFLSECERITGVATQLLSGAQEATASYIGATADLPADPRPSMIIDIGGGSTELAVVLDGALVAHSMQLGCVRVSESHLGSGVVTAQAKSSAAQMISAEIDRLFREQPRFEQAVGAVRLIGLAGTIATLAQLDVGVSEYDRDLVHHHVLTRSVVQHWADVLGSELPEQRLRRPGMVPGREDVLVGGLLVLDAVMGRFAIDQLLSSECDILDGVAAQLQGRAPRELS